MSDLKSRGRIASERTSTNLQIRKFYDCNCDDDDDNNYWKENKKREADW